MLSILYRYMDSIEDSDCCRPWDSTREWHS